MEPNPETIARWIPAQMAQANLLNKAIAISGSPLERTGNNLVAFLSFVASNIMRSEFAVHADWRRWQVRVARATMGLLAGPTEVRAVFVSSRYNGFHAAWQEEQKGGRPGIAEYFLACCSVDLAHVEFAEIEPDLTQLGDLASALTDSGRASLERQRQFPNAPRFPLSHSTSQAMSEYLSGIWGALHDNRKLLAQLWTQA